MTFGPLQDLTALSVVGKPSYLLWALGCAFTVSALCFGSYVAGLWRETLRNRSILIASSEIQPSGQTEKPSTSQEHRILDRAAAKGRIQKRVEISMLIICAASTGWMIRDRQLEERPPEYRDVLVAKRYDNRNFEIVFPGYGKRQITTCEPVDWQADEKMDIYAPKQRLGCKDVTVKGYYKFWNDEATGKRVKFKEIANVGY